MERKFAEVFIEYNSSRLIGKFIKGENHFLSSIWERLQARFISQNDTIITELKIEAPWPNILDTLREYGTSSFQNALSFRFIPQNDAIEKVRDFAKQVSEINKSRNNLNLKLSITEIEKLLLEKGFIRKLRPFQLRDIQRLISHTNGANFSVPGAGKTTVTLALHLLTKQNNDHLFVVAPKAAFPAWKNIIEECMDTIIVENSLENFIALDGTESENQLQLRSGANKFLISYDLMVRQQVIIANYFLHNRVHLILDESHRMKAGIASQRGAFLINISSLPIRRDILSGTPMPQSANDLASQLRFLWPGSGMDLEIQRGELPRNVLGNKYVRTTKKELELPPVNRFFYDVDMAPGQLALYSVVKNETLRQITNSINAKANSVDFISARKSVMRLLQLSVNPILALQNMTALHQKIESGIVDQVIKEGISNKMLAVEDHVRKLTSEGRKVIIWTIFTGTILDLENQLADLNPVTVYGATPSGDSSDEYTREGKILRFHKDHNCKVFIANPAAAGEGISLHTVCHEAIYLDRSYVSTHYLQSIDRIHRLGLDKNIQTNIHIYRTKAPIGIGSVDYSVSRRLATKIRGLQDLLDDEDLHEIAFDEENAGDTTNYDLDLQDLIDLVSELEGSSENKENELWA